MKKGILLITLSLLVTFVFSQELIIIVAPFDVRAGFDKNDVEVIDYLFLNELSKHKSIKVLDQSDTMFGETIKRMDFELSDWSNPKKVADFGRALNANAIVLGRMMKLDDEIIIAVRINDLNTEIKAANDMVVKNLSEVRTKLPAFTAEIVDRLKPQPSTQKKVINQWSANGTIFKDYTIYNSLSIFGYNYSPGLPLGFSFGFYGIYMTIGFALPDFGSYHQQKRLSDSYINIPQTDQRYEIFDWILGYNLTIIPKMLFLPIGIGIESVQEWQLYSCNSYNGYGELSSTWLDWILTHQWETNLLFEAGLLFRPIKDESFSPYIFGSYRYIMPEKHSFSLGVGISFL